MIFRNLDPSRVAVLGLLVVVGFLFSGCTAEYIKNIDKAAKTLRASKEFSDVNFEYERGLDPLTRQRYLYDFSAVLEPMRISKKRVGCSLKPTKFLGMLQMC